MNRVTFAGCLTIAHGGMSIILASDGSVALAWLSAIGSMSAAACLVAGIVLLDHEAKP